MLKLLIQRDKNVYGQWMAVTESFDKPVYRIKGGEVQVKHSGKWFTVNECRHESTNFLRDIYTRNNLGDVDGKVYRIY